jgi:hypothetical protein
LTVDLLKKTVVEKLPNDVEGLESTIERLQGMIDTVFRYVEDVVVKPSKSITFYSSALFITNPQTNIILIIVGCIVL